MNIVKFAIASGLFIWGLFIQSQFRITFLLLLCIAFLFNFFFQKFFRTTLARKIWIVSNEEPSEPRSIFNIFVDLGIVDRFIENYNKTAEEGKKVTLNLIAVLAFGRALRKAGLEGKLVYEDYVGGDGVRIMIPVDVGGKNIVICVAKDCEKENIEGMRQQLRQRLSNLKSKKDKDMNKQMNVMSLMPSFMIDMLLNVATFISYNLDLPIPPLAMKKDHFGSCIVSDMTGYSVHDCNGPFLHFTRNLVGSVICPPRETLIVKNKKIVIEKRAQIGMLSDSRVVSPVEEDIISKEVKHFFKNPELLVENLVSV